jgi:hypothetical protein
MRARQSAAVRDRCTSNKNSATAARCVPTQCESIADSNVGPDNGPDHHTDCTTESLRNVTIDNVDTL